MKGILARKIGMSQYISPETSRMIPITLLEIPRNTILQVKTKDKDGYESLVIGAFERKNFGKNTNKKFQYIQELPLPEGEYKKGDTFSLETLKDIKQVKVSGMCKGKGFAGVVKRHNFSTGRNTHGSHHHREPGSVGMCAKPGRILRGKKMPGQYGNTRKTLRAVEIIDIDTNHNVIALKGSIPGATNTFVSLIEA